jgi:preprotein translocase subunit Sec61beta
MSSKKKNAPLPASSAGLLRFFEGASIMIRILFPVG